MKNKVIILIVLLLIHLMIISSCVVYFTYDEYPIKVAASWHRAYNLRENYQELLKYKEEKGDFPQTLEPLWHVDNEAQKIFFGTKELSFFERENFSKARIQYEIINDEVVLTDLGEDNKEGGMGMNFDISYPEKYQKKLRFVDFVKTDYFSRALINSLILGFVISLCLFFIWKRGTSLKQTSELKIYLFGILSVVLLLFECMQAFVIIYGHVYGTH